MPPQGGRLSAKFSFAERQKSRLYLQKKTPSAWPRRGVWGGLCAKLNDFAGHHANPARLMYPMRRKGPKGSGKFERITWDQALGEIKERWSDIIQEHGAEAILPHAYLGNIGTLNGLTSGDRFFNSLKSSVAEKTYCESGSSTAWIMMVGAIDGIDPESFAYSKCIIFWGQNPMSTQTHIWPFVMEARKNGAKIYSPSYPSYFIADMARYADILLPATMQAEQLDIMFSWGISISNSTNPRSNHRANVYQIQNYSAAYPRQWGNPAHNYT